MGRRKVDRLTELEKERGKPAHEWLPEELAAKTQYKAAIEFDVYPYAVNKWAQHLSDGDIRIDHKWVKPTQQEQAS